MFKRLSKGFTLIELLIVVAIIAILAAIAVPNFLEAQVRAKISRAKADMRTIATGIESYSIDNGKPIIAQNQANFCSYKGPAGQVKIWAYSFLTSPVSYLTSIPTDPFREKGAINLATGKADASLAIYEYQGFWMKAQWDANPTWPAPKAYAQGFMWALYSVGPMRNSATAGIANTLLGIVYPATNQTLYHYDPTNGTVSSGYIVRSNKGEFSGPSRYTDQSGNPI